MVTRTKEDIQNLKLICLTIINKDIDELSSLLLRDDFSLISLKLKEMRTFVNRAIFEIERSD